MAVPCCVARCSRTRPDQEHQPAKEFKEDKLPDLQKLFSQSMEWLKKQQTGLLKDYPIEPPADPELQRLVSLQLSLGQCISALSVLSV